MTTSFWRKAVALPLAWVMTVTSMLWAAPTTTVFASPAPNPVPYVYVEPPLLALARAFEEAFASQAPEPPPPLLPLPRRVAAFAFGADSFTRSPYTKVVQGGANFLYAASRSYGYTDVDGLDDTPNNRGVFSGPAELYDQLIGAKPAGADIVFRVDVPNGTYRFVAAGGDPKYGDHLTTVRVRDGGNGESVSLVQNFRNLNREFWRVGFEGNLPPSEGALFAPLADSPTLTVTSGFVEVHQIAGTGSGINAGGDLNLIELWLAGEPPAAERPGGLVRAFAFGADNYTRSYYTKIVQGGANFLYDETRGFGYSDISGLDTSPNNRGFLSGNAELYDQFIGAKPGGASIVFKVKVPNGHYRLVLAGGDVENEDHKTTILARDGSDGQDGQDGQDGKTTTLVDGLENPMNEFYRIGFEGKQPPFTSAVNFLPVSTSPVIEVTKGFLEIHQIAGASAGAGGDLCLLEIWQAAPVVPPPDFVAAFAFGADSYTRSHYTKVVQDGLNFLYDAARGYGYTGVSGLDTTPNNRGVLPAEDEIYDQFIGAKPGGTSIVFRIDVPPGEYRFVAAGGDARYPNHKTSIRLRDGSSGSFVSLVENLENPAKEFYRAGFEGKHAPSAASVNFLPEINSPTLTVTSGVLEVHQIAGAGFAAGGDLSIFEIWRAGTVVPPSVAIESPADGAFFTSTDVPVRVTFTGGSVLVTIDGVNRTPELLPSPGLLEGTLTLGDGDHRIEAGAEAHQFTVDTEPPVLTLDPPAPYVRATPLVVTGTMSDRDPAAVVECPSATLEAGRFTCTFPLGEGSNTLTVRASDRGGRETTASASVTLDTEAPEITILSPTPDTYTMASSIDVTGGVFDDSPVTVRAGSVDAVVNGNNFAATGVPVGTSSNLIRVVATDAAGNVKEATVTVFFDAEPPLVTLTSPIDGAILPSPLTVTGTVADTAPVILVDVNGQPVMVENGSFTTTLTALDGPLAIVATAQDAAGNPGTAEVTVRVDSTAPVVSVVSPLDGAVTSATPISIQGSVADDTAVSLTLNGAPKGSGFPIEAPLTKGGNLLEIVATDAAGNSSSVSLSVVLDTDAPELLIVSPSEGELLVSLPVLVQGTVQDETAVFVVVNGVPAIRTGNAWQVAFDSLREETHGFTAVATDAAGNSTALTVSATLDTTPPVVAITTPAAGFLTREATAGVTGTVEGASSVTVNGVPATVTGGGFFATVALADGDNPIRAVATDAAGRSTEAVIVVTQDAIPPTLDLVAPETLSGITSGKVLASASDNLALAEVILRVNGETRGVFTGPPFEIDLVLPDGAQPGDTLVVSAEATDVAGNRTTTSRGVIVIEDGVIVGQVLNDKTSLPIVGASVTMGSRTAPTDARGQYSLPTGDADVVLRIDKPGMTSVERRTSVLADVGTVPVDARLTPLTGDRTELSPQGLPALLPLGWSPLSGFQVTSPTTVAVPDNAYLAQYRFSLHEWVMLSVEGPLDFEVPEAGSYAVVLPDPEVSAQAPGEILEGVDLQILPASVTTESKVEPAVLPPSGGVAAGSLSVFSPVPLPSGTVIQAEITETFTLASGDIASEETRYEDIVLFRTPDDALAASFPITSSLSTGLEDVVSGEVNLDLLAGREAVRGVRAGSRALTVNEGDFRLFVPGSTLPEDTAISLRTFDSASFGTLAEVFVDLSGQVLSMGAELSMAADGLSPDDTYILARIVRIDGVPRMEFISLATLAGDQLSAPGIRSQGSYVFYRSFSLVGFVAGNVSAPGAVVETSGLPFVSVADATGAYRTVATTGPLTVTAYVPRSSLRATASADVVEGETTRLDLTLSGQMTTATVTPGDGALGVPVTAQIDIASSAPLAPGPTVRLLEAGAPVLVRLVLSGSGKSLAVIPEDNLKHETTYTLEAKTLADVFGGAVVIPQTTFTTGSKETLSADPDDVTFSLPGDNGIVEVSAFGLPPGTTVLLVNSGNGIVVSFTYVADGVLGEIPASISDRILVTLTDPAGSVVTFEKSKFTAPDGTTAIGPGGGTVEGPGGVELRIPEGALPQGVELKIRSVSADEVPVDQRPVLPGGTLASGLEVQAASMPQFQEEVKLAFPKPADAPEGAFFYVYRKHQTPTGEVLWETIDHAFIEGDKVVTASLPFAGLIATYALTSLFAVVWTYAASRLDKATTGTVTGKVLRTVFQTGTAAPRFDEIPGVDVYGIDPQGKKTGAFAISQKDGTYTFFDETFRDGTVRVRATAGDLTQEATAYKINVEDDGPSQLRFYENIATANLTFPPIAPRPPPPAVGVVIFKKNPDGSREPTDGLVVESDTLVIGFTTKDTIQQARINGEVFNVRRELDTAIDWVLDQDFTPGRPGTFLIETTALGGDGSIADVAVTFRAIASGGSNNDTLHDEAPSVITLKTVPRNDATGVPVDIFPQVTFTEPVINIPGNVSLIDSDGQPAGFVLSGVGPDGPIADVSSAGAKVTSLTLQPMTGLKFGKRYTLSLAAGIEDLDEDSTGAPTPKNLVPFTSSFTTFGPESLGGTEDRFGSAGIVVLEDRAFLVENNFFNGTLRAFDITDPVEPQEIVDAQAGVDGRPVDLAGEPGMVVVATGPTNRSRPSTLYLFDVTSETQSRWVGAASVASSAQDGFVQRVDMLDGLAYVLTGRKGIHVVNLQEAMELFQTETGGVEFSPGYFSVRQRLNTAGQGFGQLAVSQPIPLPKDANRAWFQQDLAVSRIQANVWVGTTGEAPLILVNPTTRTSSVVPLDLITGSAIELGQVKGRDLALVAGWGSVAGADPGWAFAVVDLSQPTAPFTLAIISLPLKTTPTDILLTEDVAIIASETNASLVNLADPAHPLFAGTIDMVGGVLALTDSGLLLSTARSPFGGDVETGGVNTAALDLMNIITTIDPIALAIDRTSIEPQPVRYRTLMPRDAVTSSRLEILRNGVIHRTLEAPLDDTGRGELKLAEGTEYLEGLLTVRLVVSDESRELVSAEKGLDAATFDLVPLNPDPLEIGGEPLDIAAVNAAWLERLHNNPDEVLPGLTWQAPGRFVASPLSRQTGIFVGDLTPLGIQGNRGPVRLLLNDRVLAETTSLVFEPGEPNTLSSAGLTATPPPQSPNAVPGHVPADGTTVIRLILDGVRDQSRDRPLTNIAKDGTPVSWTMIEGEDGALLDAEDSVLINGRAEVGFRAGVFPGDVVIRAESGEGDFRLERTITIVQEELQIQLIDNWPTIVAEVNSAAGPPKDGTPIQWGTNQGIVQFEKEVLGGISHGEWLPPPPLFGFGRQVLLREILVFATAGRARGDILRDRQGRPIDGELSVRFEQERVLADVPHSAGVSAVAQPLVRGEVLAAFPTSVIGSVSGKPGETVRLSLGSPMFPGVEPVAAFPFDTAENGEAVDIYGGPPASLGPGVSLDELDFPGTYRFTGNGGVIVSSAATLAFTTNFGFNAAFRFDSLSVGQVILEKQESYGIELVDEAGEPRLEFFVIDGGERRSVRWSQALQVDTVYSLSAHLRDGQLRLSVGDDDLVQLGDTATSVDVSASALVVGPSFQGNLDDAAFYDFTRAPLLLFADGSTEREVTLGPDGLAQIEVVSGATFGGTAGLAALQSEPSPATGPFANRLRTIPIGTYSAPNQLTIISYSTFSALAAGIGPVLEPCLEGLATGEEGGLIGAACDIAAAFVPGVGATQDGRDLYFVAKAFADGKEELGDYIKGGFAVVGLALVAFPAAKGVATTMDKAQAAFRASRAEARLAKEAMERVGRVVAGGADESSTLFKIAAGESGTSAGRRALIRVLGVCTVQVASLALFAAADCLGISVETQRILERLATRYADDADGLLQRLGQVIDSTRFGRSDRTRLDVVERLIQGLEHIPFRLGGDALDGAAVLIVHTKSSNRMRQIWEELTLFEKLDSAPAQEVAVTLYRMINTGEDRFGAAFATGWHNLIAQGAGVSRSRRSARGFFHSLESILAEAPETIKSINTASEGFYGFPDTIIESAGRKIQKEFKAIGQGNRLSDDAVSQLWGNIGAAVGRASPGGQVDPDLLKRELEALVYVFRGDKTQHGNLLTQMLQEARRALGDDLAQLADVLIDNIKFERVFPY